MRISLRQINENEVLFQFKLICQKREYIQVIQILNMVLSCLAEKVWNIKSSNHENIWNYDDELGAMQRSMKNEAVALEPYFFFPEL